MPDIFLLSSALCARAAVTQADFTGVGNIFVLNSSDWRTATPDSTVGCLDDNGWFINYEDKKECGTFSRLDNYPYTLSSKSGNCTFTNQHTPANTDSHYGQSDHAWSCTSSYTADVYDELYTIDGFPYTFLCFGDVACFYDGKKVPSVGSTGSLWQFRWGSQQMGITPGHIQLQLLWSKISDSSKRIDEESIPGPRVELKDGMQVPLQGQQIRN
ncbi:hypothetical protein K491DRAFT_770421 [Lophiostoma macrostomum CBS 122681]|uniref:Lytic polysaccharide monooxygenase n=1 Tax=Lophiostoma macrostomum CBS 122681 TaxID=1314788 RepID=A0A6A6SYK4_9PLEO|nr:hypothetical protein K491DRAFT_770421 [Lophiostoma macrostomum CBS 122681]